MGTIIMISPLEHTIPVVRRFVPGAPSRSPRSYGPRLEPVEGEALPNPEI